MAGLETKRHTPGDPLENPELAAAEASLAAAETAAAAAAAVADQAQAVATQAAAMSAQAEVAAAAARATVAKLQLQQRAPEADTRSGKRRATEPSNLTGIGAVQHAFHFLDGPADVLRASTASRRWRELACGDAVWRAKAEREGIHEKAAAFGVSVPTGDQGEDEDEDEDEDETRTRTRMAFFAEVFALKVPCLPFRCSEHRSFCCHPPLCRGLRTSIRASGFR